MPKEKSQQLFGKTVTFTIFFLLFLKIIYRNVLGSIYGIFFITISTYIFLHHFSTIKPFSFDELIFWLTKQSEDTRLGIITTIVTVFGFLFAYTVASKSINQEIHTNIKVQASSEIHHTINKYLRSMWQCHFYAQRLIKTINSIANKEDGIHRDIESLARSRKEYEDNQNIMHEMHMHLLFLQGSNAHIVASTPLIPNQIEKVCDLLGKINNLSYLPLPSASSTTPEVFLKCIDIEKTNNFIVYSESMSTDIAKASGAIRGGLSAKVAGVNFWTLLRLLSNRKRIK